MYELNKLYNADCMQAMKEIPDKYFELAIVDPPYGIGIDGQHGLTMSDCELAYSSFECPTRVVVINRCELQRDGTFHPTQKPVKLYEWLLSRYAKPGDKIIDTHAGSGSCLIACHNMGYEYIGFEIDKDYFCKATERIETVKSQLRLWDLKGPAQENLFLGG